MKTNLSTKKLVTYTLAVILGTAFFVTLFEFPDYSSQFQTLVLVVTLAILGLYAYDTHRIAEQTIEINLKPTVLRIGFIKDWYIQSVDDIQLSGEVNLKFITLKNIAKDIQGYFIKDKKKYQLLFGNNHTVRKVKQGDKEMTKVSFALKWGWLAPGDTLFASFNSSDFEEANKENKIYITYKDVQENVYFTFEDSDFSHHFGKI